MNGAPFGSLSGDALDIVKQYQRDDIYIVPNDKAKVVLTKALKLLFEDNADTYIPLIRVAGSSTGFSHG